MLSSVHNTLPPRFQCKEIFTLPIKLVRTASVKISVCVFSDVLAFVHPMPGKKKKNIDVSFIAHKRRRKRTY